MSCTVVPTRLQPCAQGTLKQESAFTVVPGWDNGAGALYVLPTPHFFLITWRGILVPSPGIDPASPLHWKHSVLTTGRPGKSPKVSSCWFSLFLATGLAGSQFPSHVLNPSYSREVQNPNFPLLSIRHWMLLP